MTDEQRRAQAVSGHTAIQSIDLNCTTATPTAEHTALLECETALAKLVDVLRPRSSQPMAEVLIGPYEAAREALCRLARARSK